MTWISRGRKGTRLQVVSALPVSGTGQDLVFPAPVARLWVGTPFKFCIGMWGGRSDLSSPRAPLLWVSQQVSVFYVCSGVSLTAAWAPRD